jgi:hypothetical protein
MWDQGWTPNFMLRVWEIASVKMFWCKHLEIKGHGFVMLLSSFNKGLTLQYCQLEKFVSTLHAVVPVPRSLPLPSPPRRM